MSERKPGDPITVGEVMVHSQGGYILLVEDYSVAFPLTDAPALAASITTLAAEAGVPDDTAALVDAVVRFGRHSDGCLISYRNDDDTAYMDCDCGFDAALSAAREWQVGRGAA